MKRIDQRLAPGYTFSIGETVRLDFRFSEIEAEIVESSMSESDRFTIRTCGKSIKWQPTDPVRSRLALR